MSLFTDKHKDANDMPDGIANGNGFHTGNGTNGTNGAGRINGAGDPAHAGSTQGGFAAATPAMYAEYAGAVQRTLTRMPWDRVHAVVQALVHTWENGAQVLLMGNGGSASTASHLACDLSKNTVQPGLPRMRALALNDNMALMSAYANDVGYDAVFAEQMRALARPGDLVLAISTSGNSPNVLCAMEVARKLHLRTVGLCGYSGGKLADLVDIAVVAPNHCVEQIEDIHMLLAHLVTVGVRSAMQAALLRGAEFQDGVLVQHTAPAAPVEVRNGANGHYANGNGSNGIRNNGSHGGTYTHPAVVPGYWQNSTAPLNGHD